MTIVIRCSALLLAFGTCALAFRRQHTQAQQLSQAACSPLWGQCGGGNWNGATCCEAGSACVESNEYYSQCLPSSGPTPKPTPTLPSSTPRPTTTPSPSPRPTTTPSPAPTPQHGHGWTGGTWTTGYWDCCKPSCSWPKKGRMNRPVRMCHATTGANLSDPNAVSVCNGGMAASCSDNQPFQVNAGLSMGFAAAAVGGVHGLSGDANCGQCFELQFTDDRHKNGNWGGAHPDLVGKSMIVQVTNIGYDVSGEHSFDIQIPGAGQGAFTSGCKKQFPDYHVTDFDCANNYGGCSTIAGCAHLPEAQRHGCEWRFSWYKWLVSDGQTNNPYVNFRRVKCPPQLTSISGSWPLDDDEFPSIDPAMYE